MSNRLPIIAAIPAFEMADPLNVMLPEVLEQGYDAVYVLDDKSTDHTRDVVAQFEGDVQLVAGDENVGSGANRNRILPVLGRLEMPAFII